MTHIVRTITDDVGAVDFNGQPTPPPPPRIEDWQVIVKIGQDKSIFGSKKIYVDIDTVDPSYWTIPA